MPLQKTTPDVKRTANLYMTKLSDRDTEVMAASELESMARSLPCDSISAFLSAVADTRASDKTPLRRHSLRLFSLLSRSHAPSSLSPHLPRMLSSLLRRLRDPDSSVRAAAVDAVRSMAAVSSNPSAFLRPISEALLLEQDVNAQTGSALCLAAAVEGLSGSSGCPDLGRLVQRLVKLAKSEAFRAKPALMSLFGAVIAVGSTPSAPGLLVPCLIEFLGSDDWATRKAAAEALSRVAEVGDKQVLAGFKSSCISSYESRRFDKVKIVRDSMNQMLEAWKNLPGSLMDNDAPTDKTPPSKNGSSRPQGALESANNGCLPNGSRISSSMRSSNNSRSSAAKSRFAPSRSPPPEASPIVTSATRKNASPSTGRRASPPVFPQNDRRKPSDWKVEIAYSQRSELDEEQSQNGSNSGRRLEPKRLVFEDVSEEKVNKFGCVKAGPRVVPLQEKESTASARNTDDSMFKDHKENNELSVIRNQLAQIENQQSNLMDLLQRFIGSSQNGIHALETRVHGLELALEEISQDLVSSGKMSDASAIACCKLPGAEFLSSRFWKRPEGRYSPRLSTSSAMALTGIRNSSDRGSVDVMWDKRKHGIQGGFIVNPLAEASSSRFIKTTRESGCS